MIETNWIFLAVGFAPLWSLVITNAIFAIKADLERVVTYEQVIISKKSTPPWLHEVNGKWVPSVEIAYTFDLKNSSESDYTTEKKLFDQAKVGDIACLRRSRVSKDETASSIWLTLGECKKKF